MGWNGVGREKNKPSETGAMKWRAGKARCMAITTTCVYCWFSHDVTKIQTTKLSILPIFYFHDVLGQLKNNFHTNFRFKRVLAFVIEYA